MIIETIEQACEKLSAVGHNGRNDWQTNNANYYSWDLIRLAQSYEDAEELAQLRAQVRDVEDREAEVCPEDVPFDERIRWLVNRVEAFDSAMRDVASFLGAGGYSAETLTPETLRDKINWGIEHIVGVEIKRRWMAERRPSDSEMMALLKRVNRDFELEIADLKRQLNAKNGIQAKANVEAPEAGQADQPNR